MLTKLPLAEVIASPAFGNLSEFEKCWVLGEQKYSASESAFRDGSAGLAEFGERLSRFDATIKQNADAYKLYQKYSSGQGL